MHLGGRSKAPDAEEQPPMTSMTWPSDAFAKVIHETGSGSGQCQAKPDTGCKRRDKPVFRRLQIAAK